MSRTKRRIPASSGARAITVAATLTIAVQRPLGAQDSSAVVQDSTRIVHTSNAMQREGWIVGPLVGVPGAGAEVAYPLFTLGVGATRLVPDHMGLDFAIGTAPTLLADGVIPIGVRIGPSIPMSISRDVFFIPSAGFSAVGGVGAEGAGGALGWFAGAAIVAAHGPVGLRAGMTVHTPLHAVVPVWLAEVGIMSVPLPRLAH